MCSAGRPRRASNQIWGVSSQSAEKRRESWIDGSTGATAHGTREKYRVLCRDRHEGHRTSDPRSGETRDSSQLHRADHRELVNKLNQESDGLSAGFPLSRRSAVWPVLGARYQIVRKVGRLGQSGSPAAPLPGPVVPTRHCTARDAAGAATRGRSLTCTLARREVATNRRTETRISSPEGAVEESILERPDAERSVTGSAGGGRAVDAIGRWTGGRRTGRGVVEQPRDLLGGPVASLVSAHVRLDAQC